LRIVADSSNPDILIKKSSEDADCRWDTQDLNQRKAAGKNINNPANVPEILSDALDNK